MGQVDDTAVKIAVRERPISLDDDIESAVTYHSSNNNILIVDERPFAFDFALGPNTEQEEVFDILVRPLVINAVKGFNCTALAYGQTGTGKTYTMGLNMQHFEGENIGVVPRALKEIFEITADRNSTISVSFIEIYNEKAFDLLSDNPAEQINVKGYKFSGGVKTEISNFEDGCKILIQGNKNRHVRPTKINPNSSRSHAIFTTYISTTKDLNQTSASLHLVDLAGSEGVRRTGHQGAALVEGVNINQGLLSIGKVLHALAAGGKVIPFRDSVLSSVLQDSLNSNSFLTLLACISPLKEDLSETLSTLRFAESAKSLKNNPQINSILLEIKRNKAKTPQKIPVAPLRHRNGTFTGITPTPLKRTFINGPGVIKSSTKKSSLHRNTFCTPAKTPKMDAKKFNQSDLIGLTSKEKQKEKSNFAAPDNFILPKPRDTLLNTDLSRASIFSLNVSTSTAIEAPTPVNSYSPIVRRCMLEFKTTFEDQMKKMIETFSTAATNTTSVAVTSTPFVGRDENHSNDLPWNSIRQEVQKIVQHEIQSLTIKPPPSKKDFNEHRASQIDHIRTKLFHDSNTPEFKKPATPKDKSFDVHNDNETILNDITENNITVLPNCRRSLRIPRRIDNSILENTSVRRSLRLSIAKSNLEQSLLIAEKENENSIRKANKKPTSKKRKTPTDNKTIAEYFTSAVKKPTKAPTKNSKAAHKQAILDLLNSGSMKELQLLPTIGLKTAYLIVTNRTLNGKFKNFEQIGKLPIWRGTFWERFMKANSID